MHYIAEGVDHVVLIDNNPASHAGESCELLPLINAGVVTLIKDPTRNDGVNMINRYLMPFLARSKWVLNAELDEFVYARRAGAKPSRTIWHFLWKHVPANVGCVMVPWKMFAGGVAVQHPGSPIAMLTDRGAQDTTPGRYIHTKWACRSEALARFEVHWPVRRAPFTGACGAIWPDMECVVPGEKAVHFWSNASLHLNHYPTQSREVFYESKMKRGDAMRAKKDEHVRNWGYFHRYSNTFSGVLDDELARKRLGHAQSDQAAVDRLVCGITHPGGSQPEWCTDTKVLH